VKVRRFNETIDVEKDDYVKCLSSDDFLTQDKIYSVINKTDSTITVRNDNGNIKEYPSKYFKFFMKSYKPKTTKIRSWGGDLEMNEVKKGRKPVDTTKRMAIYNHNYGLKLGVEVIRIIFEDENVCLVMNSYDEYVLFQKKNGKIISEPYTHYIVINIADNYRFKDPEIEL
jgi:hypothetical protein